MLQKMATSKFQSPLGEVVKETVWVDHVCCNEKMFQSPLGEVVKETYLILLGKGRYMVSIPSRGSGKGDSMPVLLQVLRHLMRVSIPSRGSGKGDSTATDAGWSAISGFNPLSGKW